jgi:hypothetical protein
MPDLKQALKDFVATSNSGKYADEQILLSKFPELKGYDINVLKDFVATSNSGKYKTEDEIFSKFPEFSQQPEDVKKNEALQPSQNSSIPLPTNTGFQSSTEATQPPVDFQNYLKETKRLSDIGTTRPGDIASLQGVAPQESEYAKQEKESLKKSTEFTQKRREDAIVNTAKRRLKTYSQVGNEVKENEVSQDALNAEIANVKKLFKEGELVQLSDKKGNPVLAPKSTFFESVGDALTESIQAPVDATSINIATAKSLATGDDSDLIKILDEKIAEQPDVPERVASGFVGGMGELIGSVAKPIALARINPKLMVAEAAYSGFASNLLRLYQEGLNQGLTPSEAISKAKAPALAGAGFDAAAAYALTRIHPSGKGGIVSNLISKAPQETAKKVFVDAIGNTLKSASKFAAISAGSTTGKDVSEKIGGYDRDLDRIVSDALESGKEGFIMDLGFKVMGGVGDLARIPKYVKSTAKEYLSTLPTGIVNAKLESLGNFGEKIKTQLNDYREVKKQFEGIVPSEQVPTFASWQQRINSLKEKNAELQGKLNMGIAEAAQEPIKKQIESNNKEIETINTRLDQYLKTNRIVESDIAGNQLNGQEEQTTEPAKPKTLDEIQDEDLKNGLLQELEFYNDAGKQQKEVTDEFVKETPFIVRPFARLAAAIEKRLPFGDTKALEKKVELIKNNPEQYINEEIADYEKDKAKEGEDFKYQESLDRLKELQSKIQQENAIQEQTTDAGVLRSEQPEMGLQEMGEGNAQPEATTGEKETVVDEKQKRKIELENALSQPENGKGTVTIGDSIIERPDAQAELDLLNSSKEASIVGEKENVETPKAETPTGRFEKIGNKVAESIMNLELPDWGKIDNIEGTNVQGTDAAKLKKMIADAVVKVGKMMDGGVDFAISVKDATKELVDLFGEKVRGKIESTIADHFNKGEGLSEAELPGYERAMSVVEGIVEKTLSKKDATNEKAFENVINYLQQDSKVYEKASDVQRELLVREVRRRFGLKEKSAPKAGKLLEGVKDVAKITMTEKAGLVKQIKDLARGARDAKVSIETAMEEVSKSIKKLAESGTVTGKQVGNVLRKFADTNFLKSESIERFTDYMTKVFNKADYAEKLSKANNTKSDISRLSADKERNANLTALGKEFAKIDPSMVEDIDAYNEMALKIKESLTGSKAVKGNVKFADIVNIEKATEYIENAIDAQNKKLFEYKVQEVQDAMGVDASELSYEQLKEMLEKDKPLTDDEEKIVRSAAMKMFDINSTIIKSIMETGKDPFTGEDIKFSESQSKLVERFMDMDLKELTPKEALQAVDALTNFIQNKSTAKMEAVVSEYTGRKNMKSEFDKGVTTTPLKRFFSKNIAKILLEQVASLPALFEAKFKGVDAAGRFYDALGLTELGRKKNTAKKQSDNIIKDYVKKFGKLKANGKAFNTDYNNVERGLGAFMMRNVIGTEAQVQKEFSRRKGLAKESIEVLKNGNEQEQAKAKVYQEVYDKILKDSKNAEEVKSKIDKNNLNAIDFWVNEWSNKYDELADVSLNVYNKVLDKDINYNPDRYSRLSSEDKVVSLKNNDSNFHNNNDVGNLYKKENGVLMTASRPEKLPVNEDTKKPSRYVDFSFDKNNANSMYDALVDTKTAAEIRQVDAAINSDYFEKIMGEDTKLFKNRIDEYVKNIRNKNEYSKSDELTKAFRRINRLSAFGVAQALGGVSAAAKQTISVGVNTLFNAGRLDLGALYDPAKIKFINESGESIGSRGIESQAHIESLDKLINKAAESTPEQAMRMIEKANSFWLKTFLVKPDVYIARSSWLTYYEKALKSKGENVKNIDYNNHAIDKDAASYATRMVDRQQNISDHDLAGSLFNSKNAFKQVMVKMFMPFASFRMNQSVRLGNDLSVLKSWDISTKEDKVTALKSLVGFSAEMAVFRSVSGVTALLLGSAAKVAMGKDESEEDYEKRKSNILKGQATGTFTDLFSPLPILDKAVQQGGNLLIDKMQDLADISKDDRFNIYGVKKEDYVKNLGTLGISLDRANQLFDLSKLAYDGGFKDDFGKQKYISQQDQDGLLGLIPFAVMSDVGLAPNEVNSVVRYAMSDAKKHSSTKEGGKTDEDLSNEEENKTMKEDRGVKKESDKERKISVIKKLIDRETDKDVLESLKEDLDMLEMSKEELKAYKDENETESIERKKEKIKLLGKYDNESDMKRYDPYMYERNFGEYSDYYKKYNAEDEAKKEISKKLREEKDAEMNYTSRARRKPHTRTVSTSSYRRRKIW